jgi:hypothetical protein
MARRAQSSNGVGSGQKLSSGLMELHLEDRAKAAHALVHRLTVAVGPYRLTHFLGVDRHVAPDPDWLGTHVAV